MRIVCIFVSVRKCEELCGSTCDCCETGKKRPFFRVRRVVARSSRVDFLSASKNFCSGDVQTMTMIQDDDSVDSYCGSMMSPTSRDRQRRFLPIALPFLLDDPVPYLIHSGSLHQTIATRFFLLSIPVMQSIRGIPTRTLRNSFLTSNGSPRPVRRMMYPRMPTTTTTTSWGGGTSSLGVRFLAIDTSTSNAFDRNLKRQQKDNAARAQLVWKKQQQAAPGGRHEEDDDDNDVVDYDYFRQEMANRLVERLDDIRREEG